LSLFGFDFDTLGRRKRDDDAGPGKAGDEPDAAE
jgi:hypothetical protein